MQISFGDGAAHAFRTAVQNIPAGYTIQLLGDADDDSLIEFAATSQQLVAVTPDGVAYRELDENAAVIGPIKIFTWEELRRVHVY